MAGAGYLCQNNIPMGSSRWEYHTFLREKPSSNSLALSLISIMLFFKYENAYSLPLGVG